MAIAIVGLAIFSILAAMYVPTAPGVKETEE
jgi:type II secretory pathway pseudopilin PulG